MEYCIDVNHTSYCIRLHIYLYTSYNRSYKIVYFLEKAKCLYINIQANWLMSWVTINTETFLWWQIIFDLLLATKLSLELNLWHLEKLFAALLLAGNHPAHIDVIVGKGLPGRLNGGLWQSSRPAQDPGKVDVEEPQNVCTGINQGVVHVVRRYDPVWRVREHCGAERSETDEMLTKEIWKVILFMKLWNIFLTIRVSYSQLGRILYILDDSNTFDFPQLTLSVPTQTDTLQVGLRRTHTMLTSTL